MKIVLCTCVDCGRTWEHALSASDEASFQAGVDEGIYTFHQGRWTADSCCDKCLAEIRTELCKSVKSAGG